jgi:hypothetical protein
MSTSTDGLHIATALGDGEAQVADFKQTEAAARGVFDNFKKQKEEKKKAETDLKKNFNDSLKEIKRDAIRQDYQELYEKENDIVKRFNEHVYKSNNKIDPVFVNDLKAELREVAGLHQYSAKFKHDFEKVEGILATDKDDKIDPEFKKEWLEYASLPLAKRVEYEKEKGFPQVRYREPVYDYFKDIDEITVAKDKDTKEFPAGDYFITTSDEVVRPEALRQRAEDYFISGIPGPNGEPPMNPHAAALIKEVRKKVESDPNSKVDPPDVVEKKIMDEVISVFEKRKISQMGLQNSRTIQEKNKGNGDSNSKPKWIFGKAEESTKNISTDRDGKKTTGRATVDIKEIPFQNIDKTDNAVHSFPDPKDANNEIKGRPVSLKKVRGNDWVLLVNTEVTVPPKDEYSKETKEQKTIEIPLTQRVKERINLMTQSDVDKVIAEKFGGDNKKAETITIDNIKPGQILNGYKYKGGDKAKPESWEKA